MFPIKFEGNIAKLRHHPNHATLVKARIDWLKCDSTQLLLFNQWQPQDWLLGGANLVNGPHARKSPRIWASIFRGAEIRLKIKMSNLGAPNSSWRAVFHPTVPWFILGDPDSSCGALFVLRGPDSSCGDLIRPADTWSVPQGSDPSSRAQICLARPWFVQHDPDLSLGSWFVPRCLTRPAGPDPSSQGHVPSQRALIRPVGPDWSYGALLCPAVPWFVPRGPALSNRLWFIMRGPCPSRIRAPSAWAWLDFGRGQNICWPPVICLSGDHGPNVPLRPPLFLPDSNLTCLLGNRIVSKLIQ